jgi:beta-glucosidase
MSSRDRSQADSAPGTETGFRFPDGFKGGVATAAHQVEGNNTNSDWWAWEQEQGRILEGHRSGLACDWWESAEADFDRAAEMGVNALRLSVEWARIEPRPGVYSDAALDRYAEMLRGLRERGIEPMVTLHHFSNPLWLADLGGWEDPETVGRFARFARRVVEALGEWCDLWCTVNQPNVYSYQGYMEGVYPPGKREFGAAMRAGRHLLLGHAAAYCELHAVQPHARVGLAHSVRVFDPFNPRSPLDRVVARLVDRVFNDATVRVLATGRWTLPLGVGRAWTRQRVLDWIGLNYYTRDLVAFDHTRPLSLFGRRLHAEDAELLDHGFGEFYPEGLSRTLMHLARLGVPLYVTENGTPDEDDDQRPRHMLLHLREVWRAIQAGCPVKGYYHWTLVDNFEWAHGWTLPFGLIALDPETQARTPRGSAELYAEVVRGNGVAEEIAKELVAGA